MMPAQRPYHRAADPLQVKATKAVVEKSKRRRVCSACLVTDVHTLVLGPIYSERPCDICGTTPCRGAMVQG